MSDTNLSNLLKNLRKVVTGSQTQQNQQTQQPQPKKETLFDGVKPSDTSSQVSLNDGLFEPSTPQTPVQNKGNSNSTNLSKLLNNLRNTISKVTTSANYEGNKNPTIIQDEQTQPKQQQTPIQNNNQQQNANNNTQNNSSNATNNNSSNLSKLLNNLRNNVQNTNTSSTQEITNVNETVAQDNIVIKKAKPWQFSKSDANAIKSIAEQIANDIPIDVLSQFYCNKNYSSEMKIDQNIVAEKINLIAGFMEEAQARLSTTAYTIETTLQNPLIPITVGDEFEDIEIARYSTGGKNDKIAYVKFGNAKISFTYGTDSKISSLKIDSISDFDSDGQFPLTREINLTYNTNNEVTALEFSKDGVSSLSGFKEPIKEKRNYKFDINKGTVKNADFKIETSEEMSQTTEIFGVDKDKNITKLSYHEDQNGYKTDITLDTNTGILKRTYTPKFSYLSKTEKDYLISKKSDNIIEIILTDNYARMIYESEERPNIFNEIVKNTTNYVYSGDVLTSVVSAKYLNDEKISTSVYNKNEKVSHIDEPFNSEIYEQYTSG